MSEVGYLGFFTKVSLPVAAGIGAVYGGLAAIFGAVSNIFNNPDLFTTSDIGHMAAGAFAGAGLTSAAFSAVTIPFLNQRDGRCDSDAVGAIGISLIGRAVLAIPAAIYAAKIALTM
jgi:hypothetical protein